ncbi:MAG: heparinase II/III family protein, partial [Pseudomonadota bacterium]
PGKAVQGHLIEAPGSLPWDLDMPSTAFEEALHGFSWLDDLAAQGDSHARGIAQKWVWSWIDRYGAGIGPGWTPDLTGRRLIRWINHAVFLLRGRSAEDSRRFFQSLGQQTIFLSRRWRSATPGLPRFEALSGLVYAGLALTGLERLAVPAVAALGKECEAQIDGQGGIASRNPEHLLEVFSLLVWAAQALEDADQTPSVAHRNALERMAPTLRAIRHGDSGLARYHGGGAGPEGRLDGTLAQARVRKVLEQDKLAMGFARLAGGRVTVIADAARPPVGIGAGNAHASTLSIEMTSGRRPVLVNCGSGADFGEDWHRTGRSTANHSTLCLDGKSSSDFGKSELEVSGREYLVVAPADVQARMSRVDDGHKVLMGHNGYVTKYGLTHTRSLHMTFNGSQLTGEDSLAAISEADQRTFGQEMTRRNMQGIPFDIRFHLHPDVNASLDMGGQSISLKAKSGEIWLFRFDGDVELTLEPSVYLEQTRLKPRATQQIVLTGRIVEFTRRIGWTLAKAPGTSDAVRDLEDADPYLDF